MQRNWKWSVSLWEWLLGGAALVALGALAVPGILRDRAEHRMKKCQENLTKIDGAKEQWSLESNFSPGRLPTIADLAPSDGTGYMKVFPTCPSGHSYRIEPVGSDPVCPSGLPGHSLSEIPDGIICELD